MEFRKWRVSGGVSGTEFKLKLRVHVTYSLQGDHYLRMHIDLTLVIISNDSVKQACGDEL